jgi:hypothetical protein
MKRSIILTMLFLFGVALATFAQVADTIPIVHTTGESIGTFLKNNGWYLALIVYAFLSEWLGTTGVVKEGSIYAWILNMIGKIIRGKTDVIQTKKAKFMNEAQLKAARGLKILVIGLFISTLGITSYGQGGYHWKITKNDFKMPYTEALASKKKLAYNTSYLATSLDSVYVKSKVFIRGAVAITMVNHTYNKDLKIWDNIPLDLVGFGATFQWYTLEEGQVIKTFGITPLVMTNTKLFEDNPSRLYLGAIGTFRGLVTLGLNIDLKTGHPGYSTGITYVF